MTLSFAEVKMLAKGDECFKEKIDLDMQVEFAVKSRGNRQLSRF